MIKKELMIFLEKELIKNINESKELNEDQKKSFTQLFRKSSRHPDEIEKKAIQNISKIKKISKRSTKQQFEREIVGVVIGVLQNIEAYPPLEILTPDIKDPSKTVSVPNVKERNISIQAANNILIGLPISKRHIEILGKFLHDSQAIPGASVSSIIRILFGILEQTSSLENTKEY